MSKSTVRIIYKSGAVQDIKVTDFRLKFSNLSGELTSVTWENASPRPLYVGVGHIEAVYEL